MKRFKRDLGKLTGASKLKPPSSRRRRSLEIFSGVADLNPYIDIGTRSIDRWISVQSGRIALGEDIVIPFASTNSVWGPLQPLVDYPETQELFIRGGEVAATIANKRYIVEPPSKLNVEKLIQRLVILSNARLSEAQPQSEAELQGWRLYFKMPVISGEWEMTATRITSVPPLGRLLPPLLAARLVALLLKPSVVVVMGPAGAGKSTLLNSIVNFVIEQWPRIRVSVIEQVRELVLPNSACVSRSVAGPATSVTTLIRQSLRYERPELLVLGELRGEEIWSWVEAGRLGVGTLTTVHAPSLEKGVEAMTQLMRQHMPAFSRSELLQLIDVFILMRKYVARTDIRRKVEMVAVTLKADEGALQPIFKSGEGHLDEESFLKLLPGRLMVGDALETYTALKAMLGVESGVQTAKMEPIKFQGT